jgi:hypothetical protein
MADVQANILASKALQCKKTRAEKKQEAMAKDRLIEELSASTAASNIAVLSAANLAADSAASTKLATEAKCLSVEKLAAKQVQVRIHNPLQELNAIMDGIEVNTFELEVPLPFRPIRWVFEKLSENWAINAIAREILTQPQGTKPNVSLSAWKKRITKFKKYKQNLTKMSWIYTNANWQKFVNSDVADPAYPPKEPQPPETRTRKKTGSKRKGPVENLTVRLRFLQIRRIE